MKSITLICLLLCSPLLAQNLQDAKAIDLTYAFNEKTIYWPTAEPFHHNKVAWGETRDGYWYASANYSASEHGGTHLDAPIHFAKTGWTNDQIPITHLIGTASVMDISEACAKNPDYQLTVTDIEQWETKNGKIPDGSIVLIRTGWGKYWSDKRKYLGDDTPGDVSHLHFPAFSKESAQFLVQKRKVKGVGIDTASLDPGTSKDFIAHQIFNKANVYGLENIANLDQLPATGAWIIALPMKIENGTGGPVRILALLNSAAN